MRDLGTPGSLSTGIFTIRRRDMISSSVDGRSSGPTPWVAKKRRGVKIVAIQTQVQSRGHNFIDVDLFKRVRVHEKSTSVNHTRDEQCTHTFTGTPSVVESPPAGHYWSWILWSRPTVAGHSGERKGDIQSGPRMISGFLSLCERSRETMEVQQPLRVETKRVRSRVWRPNRLNWGRS